MKQESSEEKRIDQEAADWVAKKIGGFSAEEQDAFFDWLAKDPRHSNAISEHEQLWKQMDRLVEWMPEHSDKPNEDLLKYKKRESWYYWLGGIAAALVLGIVTLSFFSNSSEITESYVNQSFVANTYESHELADGSVVEMNSGAALKVNYTDIERRVELVSREAHFRVSKDPQRPFVVSAAGFEIRAVGTAFNVKLDQDIVEVIVTEGRVQITGDSNVDSEQVIKGDLEVGQRSIVTLAKPETSPSIQIYDTTIQEMNQRLEWKPELLAFDSEPLAVVVEAFNRLNTLQIIIADEALAEKEIVATFRSSNVMHMIELLKLTMDVSVEFTEENTVIINDLAN